MRRPTRIFVSTEHRNRTLAYLLVVVVSALGLSFLVQQAFPAVSDPRALRAYLRSFDGLAPLAFVLIQAGQVVLAPVPGQVLGFVSGYLFGALYGTLYSVTGAVLGSYVAFWLSRRYGRAYVGRTVRAEALSLFDAFSERHGLSVLFVVFLVPGLPDDAICFVAGLTEIRVWKLVVVSAVGRLPGYFLVSLAGSRLAAAEVAQAALLVVTLVALSTVGYLKRDAILRRVGG